MNTKLFGALLAGMLFAASGSASAVPIWNWSGTAADWVNNGTMLDGPPAPASGITTGTGDSDMRFTFDDGLSRVAGAAGFTIANASNVAATTANTSVLLQESIDVTGHDLYSVGFSWLAAQASGSIAYWMDSTDPKVLNKAALTSGIVGPPPNSTVTKLIYSSDAITHAIGPLLLTLNSVNGSFDGFTNYGNFSSIYVVDIITTGSAITSITNQFTVPVPGSLALFGIGLLAVFGIRRRTAGNTSDLGFC